MATTVSYKGNTIATVDNNTKTLKTEGKYLEADVVLTDSSSMTFATAVGTPSSSTAITFANVVQEPKIALIRVHSSGSGPRMSVSATKMTTHILIYPNSNGNLTGDFVSLQGNFGSAPYQTTIWSEGGIMSGYISWSYNATAQTLTVSFTNVNVVFITGGSYYVLKYFY